MTARRHTGPTFHREEAAVVAEGWSSAWTPTHRQLVNLVIEVAHGRGWLAHVMEDSRGEHWGADSGFPDIFAVPDPTIVSRRGRAVAIEVKVPPDDLTVEQQGWWVALASIPGIDAVVWRSSGDRARDLVSLAELLR